MILPLGLSKVVALPETLNNRLLYLTKQEDVLNLVLPDSTQSRPAVANRKVILHGPAEIIATTDGSTYTVPSTIYTIQNYDSFKNYEVSVSRGTVSINENEITVSPDANLGIVYLGINDEFSKITVRLAGVHQPKLLYPYILDTQVSETFTVHISNFSSGNGTETCVSTEYQISDTNDFSSNVQTITETGAVTSKSIASSIINAPAYIRARYTGSLTGTGPWTTPVRFLASNQETILQESCVIQNPDPVASAQFGLNVKISVNGKILAIGANGVDSAKGAVYIYEQRGEFWELEQKIQPNDLVANSWFGRSLDLSSDGTKLAVSGNFNDTSSSSVVYLFTKGDTSWNQIQKIVQSITTVNNNLGSCISFSENGLYLAITEPYEDSTVINSGAVSIYKLGNLIWEFKQKIKASLPASTEQYAGYCQLSPDGLYLFISELYGEVSATNTGSVHVYVRSGETWSFQTEIANNLVSNGGYFGRGIAINQDASILAIGARVDGNGYVYIYTHSGTTWTYQNRIQALDLTATAWFGYILAMTPDSNYLTVSAPYNESSKGKAWLYKRSGNSYIEIQNFEKNGLTPNSYFGSSISISSNGKIAVIGITGYSDILSNIGQVAIFN